jgi:hypothetical protein
MAVLIGQTSAGTTATFMGQGEIEAYPFVAAASGDVATLHLVTKVANAGMSDLLLAIYSHDGGLNRPNALLSYGTSTAASQPATEVQVTLAAPVTVVSGTTYWLAILAEGGSQGFDWQGTNGSLAYGTTGHSVPPASWAHGSTFTDAIPEIWGEDDGGGGDTSGGGGMKRPGRHRGRFPGREPAWF